ncbi:hypothetical protein ACHBTE_33135 [Streptomyces sp. M41]|uniref:hypothetical protein n=1 Tax=Streptomyces sp. M41 TaxID=3059412 RepID=UPI00374D5809
MTTETATESGPVGEDGQSPGRLFGARGRHRRPRPRKVLLAAGGLALAAGALSLLRLTPDTEVAGLGATETDPGTDSDADTGVDMAADRSTNTAPTTAPAAPTAPTPAPKASPSATSVMGGLNATPTTTMIVVPKRHTAATPRPTTSAGPPTRPSAPRPPAPTARPPQPTPPPAPSRPTTNPPAPQPQDPDEDAVCVPVIGLCVDPLADRD